MGSEARLLIAERLVPSDNAPSEAKLSDINMLVIAGGRERKRMNTGSCWRDRA